MLSVSNIMSIRQRWLFTEMLCRSNMHRLGGVLKLDLPQRMNKFIGGVGSGSHNRDGFRISKCFLQVFQSAGHMCNLGTNSVKSKELS